MRKINSTPDLDLLILTSAAGMMDALTYVRAGVFTANMTGNTVVLGLAVAGPARSRLVPCLASLLAFSIGAAFAGLCLPGGSDPALDLKSGMALELPFASAFALLFWITGEPDRWTRLLWIANAACALGIQSVAVRRLRIGGVVTTFITGTLTTAIVSIIERARGRTIAGERGSPPLLLASFAMYVAAAAIAGSLTIHHNGKACASLAVVLLILVFYRARLVLQKREVLDSR